MEYLKFFTYQGTFVNYVTQKGRCYRKRDAPAPPLYWCHKGTSLLSRYITYERLLNLAKSVKIIHSYGWIGPRILLKSHILVG